jgi:hypothetical protein
MRPPVSVAVTAGQKRRSLKGSGWRSTLWLRLRDAARLPEGWYRRGDPARYTLSQAYRLPIGDRPFDRGDAV